jgi:hypothetical protein
VEQSLARKVFGSRCVFFSFPLKDTIAENKESIFIKNWKIIIHPSKKNQLTNRSDQKAKLEINQIPWLINCFSINLSF